MDVAYFPVEGKEVPPRELEISRGRDFAALIQQDISPFVRLVRCVKRNSGREAVIIEVEPTRPQSCQVPIQRIERIQVEFATGDDAYPDVRALRVDFPRWCVLHLNLVPSDEPASLCLFAEPWHDIQLGLTSLELIYRLQTWLSDSASGRLHRPDQPLEPSFLGRPIPLITSSGLIARLLADGGQLRLGVVGADLPIALLEMRPDRIYDHNVLPALAIPLVSKPHVHCIVNTVPRTLEELHRQLLPVGIDLLEEVQRKLLAQESKLSSFGLLVLLIIMQRQRTPAAEPDSEIVAFACFSAGAKQYGLKEVLRAVGFNGTTYDETRQGQDISLTLLSVLHELTPATAAQYSGLRPCDISLLAVGAGALGSQVIMQSMRGGLGRWTVIDPDILLPHNLARHALSSCWLGHSKAEAVVTECNSMLNSNNNKAIVADVLGQGEKTAEVVESLRSAEAIIDMSASVAVARYLAFEPNTLKRRCSLFVSPSGRDLVLLAEDAARRYRLDALEMQYYRAVATDPRLSNHLVGGKTYGNCRNTTALIPQNLMGLHAAQASRILRSWVSRDEAKILVVRTDEETLNCEEISVPISDTIHVGNIERWEVITDAGLMQALHAQRARDLPNETGGVLLGHIDVSRRKMYVCHHLPAPPDSQKQPTSYVRGCLDLLGHYSATQAATLNNIVYLGEWHSHPDGCRTEPSDADHRTGAWIAKETIGHSRPALMLILGEEGASSWTLYSGSEEHLGPIHLKVQGRSAARGGSCVSQ